MEVARGKHMHTIRQMIRPRPDLKGCTTASAWEGARHPWNVLQAEISPDVLEWLQSDSVFDERSEEFKALAIDFKCSRANVKTEEGRKFILAGALGGGSCSTQMCGLSLRHELPSPRLQAWFSAFRHVNRVSDPKRDGSLYSRRSNGRHRQIQVTRSRFDAFGEGAWRGGHRTGCSGHALHAPLPGHATTGS